MANRILYPEIPPTPQLEQYFRLIREYPRAFVYWKKEWGSWFFDIKGHMFAIANNGRLSFKGSPEDNELLREQFSFVTPGFHLNKKHWNSIDLTKSNLTDQQIDQILKRSYDLVVAKLPKSQRSLLI
jgi:predicted DNA-binding protein (MmcQ/YjbR family)